MPYLVKCPTCNSLAECSEMGYACTNPACEECGVLKYSEFTAVDLLDIMDAVIDELPRTASAENLSELVEDLRTVITIMEGEYDE